MSSSANSGDRGRFNRRRLRTQQRLKVASEYPVHGLGVVGFHHRDLLLAVAEVLAGLAQRDEPRGAQLGDRVSLLRNRRRRCVAPDGLQRVDPLRSRVPAERIASADVGFASQ